MKSFIAGNIKHLISRRLPRGKSVETKYVVRGRSADKVYSRFHEGNKRHEHSEESPREHHAGEKVQLSSMEER